MTIPGGLPPLNLANTSSAAGQGGTFGGTFIVGGGTAAGGLAVPSWVWAVAIGVGVAFLIRRA